MLYLLLHYGYAFLVLGLILEGDATLVAATILASQHYFDLRWVLAIALGVTVGGNELLYQIGAMGRMQRLLGPEKRERVAGWLHNSRSGFLTLFFSRFMWGFRLVIPTAAGVLHIRRRRFSSSNLLGGALWVALLAYFGVALQSLMLRLHDGWLRYESHIAVALFLVGILIGVASIPWQIARQGLQGSAGKLRLHRASAPHPLAHRKMPERAARAEMENPTAKSGVATNRTAKRGGGAGVPLPPSS